MKELFIFSPHFTHRRAIVWNDSIMDLVWSMVFSCSLCLTTSAQAGEPQIDILNSWVEDGYIFHVDFEVLPYHVYCQTTGSGYIGFNVHYKDSRSGEDDWTFGLAQWPDGSASDFKVESHLTSYGPQAFCTGFSPCTIQKVQMVKTWCPVP
jgi:hypothetical protein